VIAPERADPVFAATAYAIVALPLPLEALVIEIHGTVATAVHAQADCVVSVKLPLVADAATDADVGAIV
jgi:hypothetical protein